MLKVRNCRFIYIAADKVTMRCRALNSLFTAKMFDLAHLEEIKTDLTATAARAHF